MSHSVGVSDEDGIAAITGRVPRVPSRTIGIANAGGVTPSNSNSISGIAVGELVPYGSFVSEAAAVAFTRMLDGVADYVLADLHVLVFLDVGDALGKIVMDAAFHVGLTNDLGVARASGRDRRQEQSDPQIAPRQTIPHGMTPSPTTDESVPRVRDGRFGL